MFKYLTEKFADLLAWASNDYLYFFVRDHLREIINLEKSLDEFLRLEGTNEGMVCRLSIDIGLLVGKRKALLQHLDEDQRINPKKAISCWSTIMKAWTILSEPLFNFEKKAGIELKGWRLN